MKHYCPVCYKEIPEYAYSKKYQGCIEMNHLDKYGLTITAKGTIRLSKNPDDNIESWFPKEIFIEWFDAIRKMQERGSARIGKCK